MRLEGRFGDTFTTQGGIMPAAIDEARLGEFMGQMVGHMTGGAMCFAVLLGDELGLYRALAGGGRDDGRRSCRGDGLQPAPGPGMAGRAGRRRPRHLRRRGGPLRVVARSGVGVGRRLVAGVRRPSDERVRLDVHRPRQDLGRVPGGRRAELGRPPSVPVLRDRVVLPHRVPRRAPGVDRGPRRRRRHARRRWLGRRCRLWARCVGGRAGAGVPAGADPWFRLPRGLDRHGSATG